MRTTKADLEQALRQSQNEASLHAFLSMALLRGETPDVDHGGQWLYGNNLQPIRIRVYQARRAHGGIAVIDWGNDVPTVQWLGDFYRYTRTCDPYLQDAGETVYRNAHQIVLQGGAYRVRRAE